jgi:hypothetical protein
LRDPENKEEWFEFLAAGTHAMVCPDLKSVFVTSGERVLGTATPAMPDSTHEEADSRLVLHAIAALQNGCDSVCSRTVDTDVAVVFIGKNSLFKSVNERAAVYLKFGTGKQLRKLSVDVMARGLGEDKARALPFFHAMSGCDTVSGFNGYGKKSFFHAWKASEQVTGAFLAVVDAPFTKFAIDSDVFSCIERWVCAVYDKGANDVSVNECRMRLFCKKGRVADKLPPSQGALYQHFLRASFQCSVWTTAEITDQQVPSPDGWGWEAIDDNWKPVWSHLAQASQAIGVLVKCSHREGQDGPCNGGRCKCHKAQLACTDLCNCPCER